MVLGIDSSRATALCASATSPDAFFECQSGAAETRFAGLRCVLCMRPHLQPAFPRLAGFFSVWQSVDFVNILGRIAIWQCGFFDRLNRRSGCFDFFRIFC